MSVRLAKRTGFCFGVKRAVAMAEEAIKHNPKIYSLGSIIHNAQVVEALSRKGLKVINHIDKARSGAIVISSHGISPKTAAAIRAKNIKIIDTTCPFVHNAQKVAGSLSRSGYRVVIVGDKRHPEIKALVDFIDGKALVVKNSAQARALRFKPGSKVSVISQTTQSTDNFLRVVRAILAKRDRVSLRIVNTICRDAQERQKCARRLAGQVDTMLVVGGRDSGNTRRLFEVCRKVLGNSYLVETERDITKKHFKGGSAIGIASGASTPEYVIKRVIKKIIRLRNQR